MNRSFEMFRKKDLGILIFILCWSLSIWFFFMQ